MDYFLLKQDERYKSVIKLKDLFEKIDVRNINRLNAYKIEDVNIFQVKRDDYSKFLDILDNQIYLVSEKIGKIFKKYDNDVILKYVPLIDPINNIQKNYFLPIFEEVECLSNKSEFNLSRTLVTNIVLDKNKIKDKKIFKIKESEKTLIVVRLDVAESLLRRKFEGISLEKLESY